MNIFFQAKKKKKKDSKADHGDKMTYKGWYLKKTCKSPWRKNKQRDGERGK
jgi:hypothetical protein